MIIHYTDGKSMEGLLLALTSNSLRVAIPGEDDVRELTRVRDTWVSDDCEPVRIEFAWEQKEHQPEAAEEDCICPPELAARLIHLLLNGEEDAGYPTAIPAASLDVAPWQRIV